jgi:hypothetical protein
MGGLHLAQVDGDFGQRQRTSLRVHCPPHGDGIAEVRPVLNPVEMNAQGGQRAFVHMPLLQERRQRFDYPPGKAGDGLRTVAAGARRLQALIEVDDHGGADAVNGSRPVTRET